MPLDAVMPAVCFMMAGLENLPKDPAFECKHTEACHVESMLYPEGHFVKGTVHTTYDFRSASCAKGVAGNSELSQPKFVHKSFFALVLPLVFSL